LSLLSVEPEAHRCHASFFWSTEQVIENHSKQQERQRQDDTTELEQTEEDTQEEVVAEEEDDDNEEDEEDRDGDGEGDVTNPDVSFASQSSSYTDGRLVKSHSEAPIGSPKGQRAPLLSVLKSVLAHVSCLLKARLLMLSFFVVTF